MFSCGIVFDADIKGNDNYLDEPGNAICYHPDGKPESLTINQAYQKAVASASDNLVSCIHVGDDTLKKSSVDSSGYSSYKELIRYEQKNIENACCIAKKKALEKSTRCASSRSAYNNNKALIFHQIGNDKNEIEEFLVGDSVTKTKKTCPNTGIFDMTCFKKRNDNSYTCEFLSDITFKDSLMWNSGQITSNECSRNERENLSAQQVQEYAKKMDISGKKSCVIDSYNGSITLDDAQQLCASEKNEERQCSASHIDWNMIDPNGERLQGKGTVFNTKLDWDDFRKNSTSHSGPTICYSTR